MQINVNGQNYDSWESVPAEVRQELAAMLPDADKNGVPDLFETGALPPGAQTFASASIMVNGQTVNSISDLPPDVLERLHQSFGWAAPMFGTPTNPAAPTPTTAAATPPLPPASRLEPGQVLLNGVPTTVGDGQPAKKNWWRRLFGA